jgi:hypothetical protein
MPVRRAADADEEACSIPISQIGSFEHTGLTLDGGPGAPFRAKSFIFGRFLPPFALTPDRQRL